MLGGRFDCAFICCGNASGLVAEPPGAGRGTRDGATLESLPPVLIDNLGGDDTSSITALHQCDIIKSV